MSEREDFEATFVNDLCTAVEAAVDGMTVLENQERSINHARTLAKREYKRRAPEDREHFIERLKEQGRILVHDAGRVPTAEYKRAVAREIDSIIRALRKAFFIVFISQSSQRNDIIHNLYNLDPEHPPYQIIPQVLYLIKSDHGAPEIAVELGITDPTALNPPAIVTNLSSILNDLC